MSDSVFQQDGKYCITVYTGSEGISRYVIHADTFGKAIKRIVDDMIEAYPEGYDFDSEVRFVREVFEEIK